MTFVPVPDVGEFRLQYTYNTEQCENVFHVHTPGGWDASELIEMASKFKDWWVAQILPIVPNSMFLQRVKYRDLTTASGLGGDYTTDLPAVGGRAILSEPNNVTVSVKWSTSFVGRSFRGRSYHVGIPTDGRSTNFLTSAFQDLLIDAYNNLIETVASTFEDAVLVVVSKYSGVDVNHKPIPRAEGIFTPITQASVEPTLDSQRRRLPGRGI